MHLRLTISSCPRPGTAHEVEVEAPDGATAADLREALSDLLQAGPEARLSVGGMPIDDGALLGHPPLLDGAALSVVLPPTPSAPARPAGSPGTAHRSAVLLAVVGGPDAGRSFELRAGRQTIGRSSTADLTVDDPGLSRIHAAIECGPDGIRIADLGSTNGTFLNGDRLGHAKTAFTAGDLLALGGTRLRLRTPVQQPAATAPTGGGTRAVNRRPRVLDDPAPVSIALPAAPERPPPTRVPWLAMLLPLPVSAAMAFFFGPLMLAFALLGPLMMVGHVLGDRIGGRRAYAARLREHEAHLADVLSRIEAALAEERRRRLRDLPDPAEVLATATTPTSRVWERRRSDGDFLDLTVGYCSDPARTRVIRPPGEDGPEHPLLHDVPCRLPIDEVGVLGISGPRQRVLGVVRSLVGQVAALHSPLDVELWLLSGEPASTTDWMWLSRLPHAWSSVGGVRHYRTTHLANDGGLVPSAVDRMRREATARHQALRHHGSWTGGRVVVLVDGAAALRAVPGVAELMAEGPPVGLLFIAVADTVEALPTEAVAAVELSDAGGRLRLPGSEQQELSIDEVGSWWADRISRGLAPLRDLTPVEPDGETLSAAALSDLLPVDPTCAGDVAAGWADSPSSTRVPIGCGPRGTHHLDLESDGPHVLVGGTTGSGKSELLRTLIASLAVANRPDQLSFVLIDYKGGAAFTECARLPHTAGLVTDLDDHLAARALTSLTAELKRRERILADAGAIDLRSYASAPHARAITLPRLVIVIDEFRALAEELPGFIDGLVRIAALGRSLGVHLVLATQRPAGVITADIKANVNLRIALRVRDRADSEDVIDATDAAALSEQTPGRAFARSGGGPLAAFQVATVSEPLSAQADPRVHVRPFDWTSDRHVAVATGQSRTDAAAADLPTHLSRMVDAICRAAATQHIPPATPAWLPPLPCAIDASSLTHDDRWLLPLGLADRPAQQAQQALYWDLREPGHWAFAGVSGTGRSSALRTIAGHVASAFAPTEVHLYAVASGSLSELTRLRHTGAVVDGHDIVRIERLVSRLTDEVTRRRAELARRQYSSVSEWLAADAVTAPPPMIVLLDDWDLLASRLDAGDHGALTDRLLALLRDGAAAGLRAAVAGGRGVLAGRVAPQLSHKAVLRLSDPVDAALAGLNASSLPTTQPPGRAVLPDGTEVQLAVHGDGSRAAWASGLVAEQADPAQLSGVPADRRPLRVDPLPVAVLRSELPSAPRGALVFAVGGDELGPVALDPERDGRQILVAGPPRGGKSTALLALAEVLLATGHATAVVSSRPGPLDELRNGSRLAAWCRPEQPAALIAARSLHHDLVVLVDDAERVLDTPCDSALQEISELVDRDRGLIICAASTQHVVAQFRGVAAEVARRQTGLLLGPRGWGDGDAFGIRARPDAQAPPGRGLWVSRGRTLAVQVALSAPVASAPAVRERKLSPSQDVG